MQNSINTITLIARQAKPGVKETLPAVANLLLQANKTVYLDQETSQLFDGESIPVISQAQLGEKSDLVIVIGGDGSLLNVAHDVVDHRVPVLGINRGTLGFLTDVRPEEIEAQITAVLNGDFTEERRFLLEANINQNGTHLARDCALNEMALLSDISPHMIDFDVFVNDVFVCRERADGFLVATPTGSTAYALSAGGPILHPELDAVVMVVMFSHTLSSRPIVLDAKHHIVIKPAKHNSVTPRISCDGRDHIEIPHGAQIEITKKQSELRLIHPLNYDYYDALRTKLHWGKRHYLD